MNRSLRSRSRQKQINILHTTTRKRHSHKQLVQTATWTGIVVAMFIVVGIGLHFGIGYILDRVLYTNPAYALSDIQVYPPKHFSPRMIRQAADLEIGENLWTLDLPKIVAALEQLPSVSRAQVERHFPDTLVIRIRERVPVAKIVGLNDLNTRETFYLDHDGVVLKPRENETTLPLPEIIGLTSSAEVRPGVQLDQASLARALEILDRINLSPLHTSIDIRTIDLSQPLWITMVTTGDMSIRFRLEYIDQQLIRFKQIYDNALGEQRTIRTIDLTPDQNVPVTFYE